MILEVFSIRSVSFFWVFLDTHHVVKAGALGSWLLSHVTIYLHLLHARLMSLKPIVIQVWNHGTKDVLACVQLGLFLVPPDCKADVFLTKAYRGLKPGHFITCKFLLRSWTRLNLKLHLGDLRKQRYFIRATCCKVSIFKQIFVIAKTTYSLSSKLFELILHLIEIFLLVLRNRVNILA